MALLPGEIALVILVVAGTGAAITRRAVRR
jgi:hypothetical protein